MIYMGGQQRLLWEDVLTALLSGSRMGHVRWTQKDRFDRALATPGPDFTRYPSRESARSPQDLQQW